MIITRNSSINCNQAAKKEFSLVNLKEEVEKFRLPKDQENVVYESVVWAAAHKGYPYSETEFNGASVQIGWRLEEKQGPVIANIYKYLLALMPVKGGRFNPYSGD